MSQLVYGTRKFSESQFELLAHVEQSDLEKNKPIVTRTGEAKCYYLINTPDGIHVAANVVDVDGIQQTMIFNLKYINMWFKLAPETA